MLFDSAAAPADNITAGTHLTSTLFLSLRRPPRWDLYAERFALAVTLYEMAVGQLPVWGDGKTSPAMKPDVEATIARRLRPGIARGLGRVLLEGIEARLPRALRQRRRHAARMARDLCRRQTVHPPRGQ